MDPERSGLDRQRLPEIETYLKQVYTTAHGSDEGLAKLKEQAAAAPHPPEGFRVKSGQELEREKLAEFERENPQKALWMKIRAALDGPNGEQYFTGQLKNTAVPQLRGKVVDANPTCRPRVLRVAIPRPDASEQVAEIVLKLDRSLNGEASMDGEFRFQGVASAFQKDPFLLTMETSPEKIHGLLVAPCSSAQPKSGAGKEETASREKKLDFGGFRVWQTAHAHIPQEPEDVCGRCRLCRRRRYRPRTDAGEEIQGRRVRRLQPGNGRPGRKQFPEGDSGPGCLETKVRGIGL
jgi:hypothetical protein